MKIGNALGRLMILAAVCITSTGCFAYSREVETVPATVTVPAPAPATATTTTTTSDNGLVKRSTTTTYEAP